MPASTRWQTVEDGRKAPRCRCELGPVLYRSLVPIPRVRRGRWGCAGFLIVLAATGLIGCGKPDNKPDPAYQRGYNTGQGAEIKRLINQGRLPIAACDDMLTADKATKNYSFDDAAVYKQGCLDAVRAAGLQPNAGF